LLKDYSGSRDDRGSVYELASGVFIWEEKERSIVGLLNQKEVCRLIRGMCTMIGRHKELVVGPRSAPFARVQELINAAGDRRYRRLQPYTQFPFAWALL